MLVLMREGDRFEVEYGGVVFRIEGERGNRMRVMTCGLLLVDERYADGSVLLEPLDSYAKRKGLNPDEIRGLIRMEGD